MTDELSDDTERFMYDTMSNIGGLQDRPVDDCVRDVVLEMREHHEHEYDVSTQTLVEAAYDAAIAVIKSKKRWESEELVGDIEEDDE
jgi:hypothetical protein